MKAVVYKGEHNVAVENVEDPQLSEPGDAIVRVSSAAICGSDLHMYDGRTGLEPGKVLGHEIMGTIEQVGDGVQQLKVGDRVVLPFNIACGSCFNCVRGFTNACLIAHPTSTGAGYGYAGMGPHSGGQAELVRVPYADFNALKLPGNAGDEREHDFLMLADIFPTAWHACELAQVSMGKSVVIFGAGPVGLLSILSARLRGAAEIYAVDCVQSRLDKAKEMGAMPIDFTKGDPATHIKKLRQSNSQLKTAQRDREEKRLEGVDCGIDAIGYQAHDFEHPDQELATQVIDSLAQLVNPTGGIGLIGVYMPNDPGAPTEAQQQGRLELPIGTLWNKGITVGMGQCPVKRYNQQLRDLIIAGKAEPGTIVSHDVPIDQAPDCYQRFDRREEGYTKVVLHP
jgi:glutathione-independent formaldehyde dehydrogenase